MPNASAPTVLSMDTSPFLPPPPPEDDMLVGMRFDYAGTAPPPKSLVANGQAVSRTTYAALFAAIGTTWGPGDGVTTFNLPDDRNRHARGMGPGVIVGQQVGNDTHTITVAEMPAHLHNIGGTVGFVPSLPERTAAISVTPGNTSFQLTGDAADLSQDINVTGTGATDNTGGGGTIPTVPASNVYLPCIYAGV